jgi:hypothetical protein
LTFQAQAQAQAMVPLRRAPDTLAASATELDKRGIQLVDELKTRLRVSAADMRRCPCGSFLWSNSRLPKAAASMISGYF